MLTAHTTLPPAAFCSVEHEQRSHLANHCFSNKVSAQKNESPKPVENFRPLPVKPLAIPARTASAITAPAAEPIESPSRSSVSAVSVASDACSTISNISSSSSITPINIVKDSSSNKRRRVTFCETVIVGYTYTPEHYDRSSIKISPLTQADVNEIRALRMHYASHSYRLQSQTLKEPAVLAQRRRFRSVELHLSSTTCSTITSSDCGVIATPSPSEDSDGSVSLPSQALSLSSWAKKVKGSWSRRRSNSFDCDITK